MSQELQAGKPLQPYPSVWDIAGINLTLGEIASAEAVGKHAGSIFSFDQSTRLFDAVENALQIRIQNQPPWLQAIDLARTVAIYGAEMRRIKVPKIMQDLDVRKLSGLATFVVLCCHHTESEDVLIKMLNKLVAGELGVMFKIDQELPARLLYPFQGHLGAFIRSCVDADKDSDVSRRAERWKAALHEFGARSHDKNAFFSRSQEETIGLIAELYGATGRDEAVHQAAEDLGFRTRQNTDAEGWAKVHDTLHLTAAYVALTAAAHGARVHVQVLSGQGSTTIPAEPINKEDRKSSFLVRLWLKQPPMHIRGILRHGHRSAASSSGGTTVEEPSDNNVIVGGGTLELATWIASKLGLHCTLNADEEPEALLRLWQAGTDFGKKLQWLARRRLTTATHGMLLLVLTPPSEDSLIAPEAVPLSAYLVKTERRLKPIARTVAAIVHNLYGYSDYSQCLDIDDEAGVSEIALAMEFVIHAIGVQALRNTLNPAGDSADIYALNLATLTGGTREMGNLNDLVRAGLNDGISPWKLVTTAATVWGGMQFSKTSRPGPMKPADQVLGVIAPHCAVIFDLIRDPMAFVASGSSRALISIWRGPVPMLPRDPITSCVYSGYNDFWYSSDVTEDYTPQSGLTSMNDESPVLVTFEPFDHEATRGVFCFWHGGQLLSEAAPHSLLTAILSTSKETEADFRTQDNIRSGKSGLGKFVEIGKSDLIRLKSFNVKGNIAVVIKEIHDTSWLLYALACAAGSSDNSHHLLMSAHREHSSDFDAKAYLSTVAIRQVVILMP